MWAAILFYSLKCSVDGCSLSSFYETMLKSLLTLLFRDSTDATIIKSLCSLLKNFWFTCKKFFNKTSDETSEALENAENKMKKLHETFPVEFFLVILSFNKKLR